MHPEAAAAERLARLEELAGRWLAAEATDAEERELRDGLRHAEPLPESLRGYRELFEGLDALSEEPMPGTIAGEWPLAELRSAGVRRMRRRSIARWGAAIAAAAVVAVGIFFGIGRLRTPYCYIDGQAIYDREAAMQATAYFDSFAALDTPSRLVDELIGNE